MPLSFLFIIWDLLGEKVVEKLSKNDEKILVWCSVLEEHHCKCSDKYYISMSNWQKAIDCGRENFTN